MALRDEEIALEQRRKKSAKKKLATMEVPAPKANNGKKRDSLPKGSFLEAVSAAMDGNANNTTTSSNGNAKPKKKKQAKEAVRQTDDSSGADQLSQPRKTKKVRSPRAVPPPPPPPPGSPPKQQQQRQKPAPATVEKQQRQKPAAVVKPSPTAPAPKTKAAKPSKKKDKTNRSSVTAADTTTSTTTSKAKALTPDTTLAPPPTVTGESFLQSVIAANNARKAKELHAEIADDDDDLVDSEEESPKKSKKKKKGKLPKLSFERQQSLQEELAKRRVENKKKRRDYVEDDAVQAVGWFSMTVKENTKEEPGLPKDDDDNDNKKKKKPRKQLRTTVDYSRNYNFITKDEIKQAKPGYYLDMVTVKKIHFDIHNLVLEPKPLVLLNDKDKTNNPNRKRVYQLDTDTLHNVVDRKEDKWWIKSRLPAYVDEDDDEEEDDSEKGMEALSIFFGPNDIDNAPDENDADIFSIASVESVHFSDDEGENEKYFHGVARATVEVMPGEFTILRKEDETHEAIAEGTYIESLCLGCGKALLSVQDAVQVACPSCGSITPLNAICLHRPFGIATGVPAAKVKDKLAPRKSPFDSDPSKQNRPPTRKVVTAVSTRWITKEPTPEAPPAAARQEPPALANGIPNTIVTFPEDEMSQLTPMPTRPQPAAPAPPPPAPPRKLSPQEAAARRRQRPSEPQQYARKPAPTQDQQRRKAPAPKPKSAAKQMKSAIANAVRGNTKTSKQSSKQQQRTKPAMPVAAR